MAAALQHVVTVFSTVSREFARDYRQRDRAMTSGVDAWSQLSDPQRQLVIQGVSRAEAAITRARRRNGGPWRTVGHYLTSQIKSLDFLRECAVEFAAEIVNSALRYLHLDAPDDFLWVKYFGDTDSRNGECDPYIDLLVAWPKTRCDSPLYLAYSEVLKRSPIARDYFDAKLSNPNLGGLREFLALVEECQKLQAAGEPITISTRAFGELLGVSHVTVSKYIEIGKRLGMLELVNESDFKARKAATYLFKLPTPR